MAATFPSADWLRGLEEKLNQDTRYAQIARNWEGELCIQIEPSGALKEGLLFHLDLWHGKCRKAELIPSIVELRPAFLLSATYDNLVKILKGELDPLQAMMTRKLHVDGSMAYMMRNVPTVLDFVRCAREVTTDILS